MLKGIRLEMSAPASSSFMMANILARKEMAMDEMDLRRVEQQKSDDVSNCEKSELFLFQVIPDLKPVGCGRSSN